MKKLFVAMLLALSATSALATDFKFAPPQAAVCATFAGSFNTSDMTSDEENINVSVRCVGTQEAQSCRIVLNGETGTAIFKGGVGTKNGKTFVETYNGGTTTLRLLGCKLNSRCPVLQMFNSTTKVGMMCVDPSIPL